MNPRPAPETKIMYAVMWKDSDGLYEIVMRDKTFETRAAAEKYLRAVLNVNSHDTLRSAFGIPDLSVLTIGPAVCYLNGDIVGVEENFERARLREGQS